MISPVDGNRPVSALWGVYPASHLPSEPGDTRWDWRVTSAHLLGPAPGEPFAFLAFLLLLGAERRWSTGWGRRQVERGQRGEGRPAADRPPSDLLVRTERAPSQASPRPDGAQAM